MRSLAGAAVPMTLASLMLMSGPALAVEAEDASINATCARGLTTIGDDIDERRHRCIGERHGEGC